MSSSGGCRLLFPSGPGALVRLHAEHTASGLGLGVHVETLRRGAALRGSLSEWENEQDYNLPRNIRSSKLELLEVRVDSA